ncbi:hypothetical protein BGZ83_005745 [Gryganskiella cystojenkinii]|nr:hypothetical protein BGZ83_005745 [Gryganskiella cystojenkinii]
MSRFFRRKSDSLTFTLLWWFAFIVSAGGLIYYGKTRIALVNTRATVLQTKTILASETERSIEIPDILVCTHNATVVGLTAGFIFKKYPAGVRLQASQIPNSPCSSDFDDLYIISSLNNPMDTYSAGFNRSYMRVTFEPVGPLVWYHGQNYYMFTVPNDNNPYKDTGLRNGSGIGTEVGQDSTLLRNIHVGRQNLTWTYLTTYSTHTKVLASGFSGLFGSYNDSATISIVTSETEVLYSPGSFSIVYWLPTMKIENQEVLTTSIPDAFASFGGAFSIVCGVFYIFFGHSRVTPFGLIQKFAMRVKTKKNLRKVYGNWKQDKDGNYYEAAPGGDGTSSSISYAEEEKPQGSQHQRRLYKHRPVSLNSLQSLSSAATNLEDDPAIHRRPPLSPFSSGPSDHTGGMGGSSSRPVSYQPRTSYNSSTTTTAVSSPTGVTNNNNVGMDGLGSPIKDLKINNDPASTFENLVQMQRQYQQCHQELVAFKSQLARHARVLKHLQRHEQRFKDTETLLNEFYLDMDLVDTRDDLGSGDFETENKPRGPSMTMSDPSGTAFGKKLSLFGQFTRLFAPRHHPFVAAKMDEERDMSSSTPSAVNNSGGSVGGGGGGGSVWKRGFQRMVEDDDEENEYMLTNVGPGGGGGGGRGGGGSSGGGHINRVLDQSTQQSQGHASTASTTTAYSNEHYSRNNNPPYPVANPSPSTQSQFKQHGF